MAHQVAQSVNCSLDEIDLNALKVNTESNWMINCDTKNRTVWIQSIFIDGISTGKSGWGVAFSCIHYSIHASSIMLRRSSSLVLPHSILSSSVYSHTDSAPMATQQREEKKSFSFKQRDVNDSYFMILMQKIWNLFCLLNSTSRHTESERKKKVRKAMPFPQRNYEFGIGIFLVVTEQLCIDLSANLFGFVCPPEFYFQRVGCANFSFRNSINKDKKK